MGKFSKRLKRLGKVVKKVARVAAPVVGFALGGPAGAALGGALAGGVGDNGKFNLKGAALGGALGYVGGQAAAYGGLQGGQGLKALGGSVGNFSPNAAYQGVKAAGLNAASSVPGVGGMLKAGVPGVGGPGLGGWGTAAQVGSNLLGGYLQGKAAQGAAETSADAQLEAARIAADAAKFRPIGVTTSFGASRFGYDDKGNLATAGYDLSPQMKAQQDKLMGVSDSMLTQYQGAQAATAPMGQAAGTMMTLGQGYLGTTPQQQAAQYMREQQALLAAPRANQLADLRAQLQAQGRGGLAIGGNAGQMATNPEMAAYYNSLQQQDLGMAADATRGGMDYARFGSGMVGDGGRMLSDMYGVQRDAYNPYATALGGATNIEGLGQNALDAGIRLGSTNTAATAQSGQLLGQGMLGAARTMQDVNQISPWGTALSAGSQMLGNYLWQR